MSPVPAKRAATYEDLMALPAHVVGEIVDGEFYVSPRPAIRHAAAATGLASDIHGLFGRKGGNGPGGWVILFEPELHVVGQIMVPDIAGWRRERMPAIPDVAFVDLAPDWLCEVISPGTAALDRTKKMHHYAHSGVGHMWIADPAAQTLEVYRLEGGGWRLATSVAGNVKVRAEPFEAMELDLQGMWEG